MINLLIVDKQKVAREILKSYFVNEKDFEVVDTVNSIVEALERLQTLKPNVLLIDIEIPDGIAGLETIATISPDIKVIFLTDYEVDEEEKIVLSAKDGVFLSKMTPAKRLISIVRKLYQESNSVPQKSGLAFLKQNSFFSNGSGLVHKQQGELVSDISADDSFLDKTSPYQEDNQHQPKKNSLKNYLGMGILLNSLVWALALAYLYLAPPSYTSKWGVKILETDSGVEVVLPDGGKASPAFGGWTPPTTQDTRNDYVYVATSPDLLTEAAALANLETKEYKEPKIQVDEENGLITFQIEGSSPKEARVKAIAFHQTMTSHIKQLRTEELIRQEKETQETLAKAKTKLVAAQKKLSQYRAESDISTDEQIQNLTDNIESLRRQRAELASQQKGAGDRFTQLSSEIKSLTSPNAGDAYKLAADPLYQQFQANYVQIQSSLNSSSDRFTPDHPVVKEKRIELRNSTIALRKRASRVLGRSVSIDFLTQIASLTLDPQSVIAREGLQQDLANSRAEWQRLKGETKELSAQISVLESRLRRMSQDQFKVDSLKRDLQVAETVFAATLAKLDLGKENIYSIYPPLQLISKPNLPEEPSNPSPGVVFMGGLAGSFLITTGMALLWFDRKKFGTGSTSPEQSSEESSEESSSIATILKSDFLVRNGKG